MFRSKMNPSQQLMAGRFNHFPGTKISSLHIKTFTWFLDCGRLKKTILQDTSIFWATIDNSANKILSIFIILQIFSVQQHGPTFSQVVYYDSLLGHDLMEVPHIHLPGH